MASDGAFGEGVFGDGFYEGDRERGSFTPTPREARDLGRQLDAKCLDCGLPYADFPLDVVLPRSQWLEIHPDEHGLLCAACIVKRAANVPGCTVVHMILEITPKKNV